MLIVDPPYAWHTADDALAGMREWDVKSENALMYFPRILAHDKLRGHFESFAPCGAVAGMLARSDETHPVWGEPRSDEAVLRPGYRPVCLVPEDRRVRLLLRGVNTLQSVRSVGRIGTKPRTLAAGAAGTADWQSLAARRLALFIINCIERGTRWVARPSPRRRSRRPSRARSRVLRAAARGRRVRRAPPRAVLFRAMRSPLQRDARAPRRISIPGRLRSRARQGVSHLSHLPLRRAQPRHAGEPQPRRARRALSGGAQVGRCAG